MPPSVRRLNRAGVAALFVLPSLAFGQTKILETLTVDQFGYRPGAPKIAVLAAPQQGQNAKASLKSFNPGPSFEIRRSADGALAFQGAPVPWKNGATHGQSGDKAWQADFSGLSTPGTYYLSLPGGSHAGSKSFDFDIREDVHEAALRHSVRSFYYQRCGADITPEYGGVWNHKACHLGPGQDKDAAAHGSQGLGPRDVSGGWHDAGDYRKYVPFMGVPLWDLLHAADWYPGAFSDKTGIPESGNGVPDFLDEIKVELDWILRMQDADGGVFSVVGVSGKDGGSPPDIDRGARLYGGKSTVASSTLALAAACASRLFAPYEAVYPGYAARLKAAALAAWEYLGRNPKNIKYSQGGFSQADANVGDAEDADRRIAAAAELFHLTAEPRFRDYVDRLYAEPQGRGPNDHHPITKNYFETAGSIMLQKGLISYCLAPGASPDVVAAVGKSLRAGISNVMSQAGEDPYLAPMWDGHYCWGSNQIKAKWAELPLWGIRLNLDPGQAGAWAARAEEYIHYWHGRNPLSWVYLSNMGERGAKAGAEKSVMEIYHGWFHDGTDLYDGASSKFGPAPGILAGGPNVAFKGISPPAGEPAQKSYLDWNASWPENSWEVTENSVGYQSAHIVVLAAFCPCR